MKLLNIPYYCGGRLLVGLYDDVHQGLPKQIFKKIVNEQIKYDDRDGDGPGMDQCPYIPQDLLLFQQFLKKFLHVEQEWGMQGCGSGHYQS